MVTHSKAKQRSRKKQYMEWRLGVLKATNLKQEVLFEFYSKWKLLAKSQLEHCCKSCISAKNHNEGGYLRISHRSEYNLFFLWYVYLAIPFGGSECIKEIKIINQKKIKGTKSGKRN